MKNELHIGKPNWLKTKIPTGKNFNSIKRTLRDRALHTVCEEAKCPNIGECWNQLSATFMIMGDTCTRACRFCHIKTGNPQQWLDPEEPKKVAQSCAEMGLKYVVLTMVDRDDLPDSGARHINEVVSTIKSKVPGILVELLAGDMNGDPEALKSILDSRPDVFAHNIETIERLSPRVRDARAKYKQSLEVLKKVKELAGYKVFTKSAIMLGLGEDKAEVFQSLRDLRDHNVDFITIGQYMRPTRKHLSIKRWVHPDEFKEIEETAYELGFTGVASAPLVRSSYKAMEFYNKAMDRLK